MSISTEIDRVIKGFYCNGLVPSSNKPLPEAMLSKLYQYDIKYITKLVFVICYRQQQGMVGYVAWQAQLGYYLGTFSSL